MKTTDEKKKRNKQLSNKEKHKTYVKNKDRPCLPPGIFKGVNIQTKTRQTETTKYVYDGLDIVQEIQNGTVSANYIRTMNIDEPLMRIKSDGTMRFYKTDALGSVVQLTDETGVVKTTYSYDPFGNTTVSGELSDNPFQYTGRENDQPVLSGVEGGLYYYRARYYSPALQRFISEDPIGLAGGDVNFYAYVGNSPVNAVDPLGLASCTVCHQTPPSLCTECHKPSLNSNQAPKGGKCLECDDKALEACMSIVVDSTPITKWWPDFYQKRKKEVDAGLAAVCILRHCEIVDCDKRCEKK